MSKKRAGMVYRIVVRSELGERYAAAFEGMRIETRDGRFSPERSRTSRTCSASSTA